MADTKVSALPAASAVAAGNELPINEAGTSKKVTAAQLADYTHLSVPADISPAQLVANTNDWAPTGFSTASVIRLTTDASRDLTGIAGGSDGRRILLINVGTFPLIMKHESASSTAANRLLMRNGLDDDLAAGGAIQLWYDSTSSRWRGIAQEALIGTPRTKQLASQHSISVIAPTKVTGLDMTLEPGVYTFDYRLLVQTATITVGPQFNFNFTGTATKAKWWFMYADLSSTLLAAIGTMAHDTSTSTLGFQMAKAEDDFATTAAGNMGPVATTNSVQTINTDHMVQITGIIVVSVAGNIELWHGSETATATSVETGSSLVVIRTA